MKSIYKKIFTLLVALLGTGLSLTAQVAPAYSILGKVTDALTKQPMALTTVILKTDKNIIVKQMVTKTDGAFAFTGIPRSKYNIVLVNVGYQNKTVVVDAADASKINTDVGMIALETQMNNLKEVAIKADKPIIKQEIDRLSYDLQADPDSKVSNVLEMMRKVPFISIDANENILLKGNSSYKIFINGKPSGMLERDPTNILRSMPASTIQRIEVITAPPAKYDAEGLGGIINIITTKIPAAGYNGTLNVNGRYPAGPGLGTTFNIKEGKFGISAFGGGSFNNTPQTESLNTRATTGAASTYLTQQGNTKAEGKSAYIGTELSYEIDSLNLLTAQFNISGNRSNGDILQNTVLSGNTGVSEAYRVSNTGTNSGKSIDASLNYQLGFKRDKARLLTFSYRYMNYNSDNNNVLLATNRVNYLNPDQVQENKTNVREQTLQIDYVRGFKKWLVEAGVKGILRKNESDFQYNVNGLNSSSANNYSGDQNILAAYNTWQYTGKKWGIKAGARIEQTFTDADFIATTTNVKQNYLNVVPSVSMNWTLSKTSSLNLGYSQRLRRPSVNKLNPFVDRSNPNFLIAGNPELRRTIINSAQLSYRTSKKTSLTLSLNYDFVNGMDLPVATFDPVSKITTTTYKNMGNVSAVGTSANLNYPISKQLNFSTNANIQYFTMRGEVAGIMQSNQIWVISSSSTLAYAFNSGWRISGGVDVTGRNPTGLQGYTRGFVSSSLSVNKPLIKNKLTFSAAVRNPFTQYRYNITQTNGNDFTQLSTNQTYFRSFTASLNYNFGKLKDAIKKNKRGINNDDVSK
ncbi:TonB-dependent receptor domain-containing protein [Mucilaginibacter calamicampi]|uniref:TonB-dependent receptor domain-containing protein n=1 Tax=Mucilaginibacter calamicampi TaxID=1302352 RepID=A0ABW2YWU0_9SPHI